MHRYKDSQATRQDLHLMTALTAIGLQHRECVIRLANVQSQFWASVPSLRRPDAEHPFHKILVAVQSQQTEIAIAVDKKTRIANDSQRRAVNPDLYRVLTPVPKGSHITLIDDTWVSGGHARSVAGALKRAGAAQVSVLVIARWLDSSKPYPHWTYTNVIQPRPFELETCPWTGAGCPSERSEEGIPITGPGRAEGHHAGACRECGVELPLTGICGFCE
jgi:hypothetical protein